MIKKTCGIFSIVLNICFYWCSIYIFSKDKSNARLKIRSVCKDTVRTIIKKYFYDDIIIKGNIEQNDKIDVIISNHISALDFIIIITILHNFNISDYYFVLKDILIKIPIFGDLIGDDITVTRNWIYDKHLLIDQIKNIKTGKIIIYPEGTRYNIQKHNKSKQYCYNNKLPIHNYTLLPKIKGLHLIISLLESEKKFGNLYDITLISDKHKRDITLISNKHKSKLVVIINKFNISNLDYEPFKKYIYKIWFNKNLLIDKYMINC